MSRTGHAVRLGIPAFIVAVLALVALWRVGTFEVAPAPVGSTGTAPVDAPASPLTTLTEILTTNALGREASLESVRVREITSPRTFWIGSPGDRAAFVVLDPDVKRIDITAPVVGSRVTLIGLVRPAPDPPRAMAQWAIDEPTALALQDIGTYLHATEIRAVP